MGVHNRDGSGGGTSGADVVGGTGVDGGCT